MQGIDEYIMRFAALVEGNLLDGLGDRRRKASPDLAALVIWGGWLHGDRRTGPGSAASLRHGALIAEHTEIETGGRNNRLPIRVGWSQRF